jgi:hypothetical protein
VGLLRTLRGDELAAKGELEMTPEQCRVLLDCLDGRNVAEGAICEDCGEYCERVRPVPEFAFLGCDACYEGCMAMLAEEAAELRAVAARKSVARATWISQSLSESAIVTLAMAVAGSAR